MIRNIPKASKVITQLAGLSCLILSAYQTQAAQCFDFSNLPEGATYELGQTYYFDFGTVEVTDFYLSPNIRATPANQAANVAPSQIAGGAQPEIHLYMVGLKITPYQPATRISMDFGQNTGYYNAALDTNITVNGDQRIFANGMAEANGVTMGDVAVGEVLVHSTLVNPTPGVAQWFNGKLGFKAINNGVIESITLGSRQGVFDNFCID